MASMTSQVPNARFCLHTEGNGWGARVVDYMAMECLPLMVSDGMLRGRRGMLMYT